MKKNSINTIYCVRLIFFVLVIFSLALKPVFNTLILFDDYSIELTDLDNEKETDSEDKSEEDSKDEKIELQIVQTNYNINTDLNQILSTFKTLHVLSYDIEILIPPPEIV